MIMAYIIVLPRKKAICSATIFVVTIRHFWVILIFPLLRHFRHCYNLPYLIKCLSRHHWNRFMIVLSPPPPVMTVRHPSVTIYLFLACICLSLWITYLVRYQHPVCQYMYWYYPIGWYIVVTIDLPSYITRKILLYRGFDVGDTIVFNIHSSRIHHYLFISPTNKCINTNS